MHFNKAYRKKNIRLIANREKRNREIADESIKNHNKSERFGMKLKATPTVGSESFIG